jgi:hypothetical protein
MYGVPIDSSDTVEMLSEYASTYRPGYALLTEVKAVEVARVQHIVASKLGDEVLPTSIVTDARGHILATIAGVPTTSELRVLLRRVEADD